MGVPLGFLGVPGVPRLENFAILNFTVSLGHLVIFVQLHCKNHIQNQFTSFCQIYVPCWVNMIKLRDRTQLVLLSSSGYLRIKTNFY